MAALMLFFLIPLPVSSTQHIHIKLVPRYIQTVQFRDLPIYRGHKPASSSTSALGCPANPDEIISIVLKPRDSTSEDTVSDDNSLCGLDAFIDSARLLSEWNGPYIFAQLVKKDPRPMYTTQVFRHVSVSSIYPCKSVSP